MRLHVGPRSAAAHLSAAAVCQPRLHTVLSSGARCHCVTHETSRKTRVTMLPGLHRHCNSPLQHCSPIVAAASCLAYHHCRIAAPAAAAGICLRSSIPTISNHLSLLYSMLAFGSLLPQSHPNRPDGSALLGSSKLSMAYVQT